MTQSHNIKRLRTRQFDTLCPSDKINSLNGNTFSNKYMQYIKNSKADGIF